MGLYKEKENFENNFPVKQRYQGSYHKGVKDNDIFNLNNEEEKQNGIVTTGKKYYKNNNAFKSQIVFVWKIYYEIILFIKYLMDILKN